MKHSLLTSPLDWPEMTVRYQLHFREILKIP